MYHPYITEILLRSCCSDVEPAQCKKVALLFGYGTLLSLMVLWSYKKSQEGLPVQREFPFFYTCPVALILHQNLHVQIFVCMKAVTDFSDSASGEDYDRGWLPGFGVSRSSYIPTHRWLTAAPPMLLVMFLVYYRTGAVSVCCSAQLATCAVLSVFICWILTGVWEDFVWDGGSPCPGI